MLFPVSPAKAAALVAWMVRLGIVEADLEERFVRSGGSGGQHVNKTSTCVQLRHLPTGVEVRVQESRSQGLNRYLARRRLCERIAAAREGARSAAQQRVEKIRRQKRRRSRRSKEKMLTAKHERAAVKQLRRRPGGDEE